MAKRTQPHGGALNAGGTPGNKGGRPPSVLRQIAREALGDALPGLRLVAMGERVSATRKQGDAFVDVEVRPSIEERLAAAEQLKDLGLGEEIRSEDVRVRLKAQNEALADLLPPELLAPVMARLAEVWG